MKQFFQNHPLRIITVAYLGIAVALRLVLWAKFGRPVGVPPLHLPLALGAGLLNDLVECLYLGLPLVLLALLVPKRLARHRNYRYLVATGTFLALFGMLYLATVEYFFFAEFDGRFNLIAVDYLIYPTEVLVNIWESYPVVKILIVEALLALGLLRLAWPWLRTIGEQAPVPTRRGTRLCSHLGLLLLAAAGFSTDTLAWSDNRVTNELGANGISSLFQAFRTNELDYNHFYRTIDKGRAYQLAGRQLGVPPAQATATPFNLNRNVPARADGLGKMNVVVVVEESLGAGFVGTYGDRRQLTPNFDRLAKDGLLFERAFATGTRTVRGLEAITTSLPPIPSESILKRPGCEGIANWGTVMADHGYRTSFLYGGYSYFDNMRHFFAGNGFAVRDRSDIKDPVFANIWGVSDEDLFRDATGYFDTLHQAGQPFFSVIMTTSNHTPYTFPPNIPGIAAKGGGRKAGIRYADHALGRLFAEAPQHPWFANTLFVVVADHDARVYGRAQIPVERYHIPLLFYAPQKIAAGTVPAPCSQIDIAPTVLGMLGLPYSAPFYGQDVIHNADEQHPLLLNHNHDVAMLSGDRLVILGINQKVESFRRDAATDNLIPAENDPALVDLATAYYQTAFELFKTHQYLAAPNPQAIMPPRTALLAGEHVGATN